MTTSERLLFPLMAGLLLALVLAMWPGARSAEAHAGGGVKAVYFDERNLAGKSDSRTDENVDFSWGPRSPVAGIGPDTFSVRWTGRVEAPAGGSYTFYARADDGVRLWVNGKLLVNRWTTRTNVLESSGKITLPAGKHAIRMEYFDGTGAASARLLWSGPGIAKSVVPHGRLSQPSAPPPPQGTPRRWSDPATWGGRVPADGSPVTIPAGKIVLLDRSVSPKNLQIDGTLIFEDTKDLELKTDWIMVHGRLQVGTEAAPFRHRAVITLADKTPGENVMEMGDKVLGVMGGTLELHGQARKSWTRLAANVPKGRSTITVADPAGWRVGDRVAVASTDFDPAQTEQRVIVEISGRNLKLDQPLGYGHWGTVQTVDGKAVDQRAEVALLSRNVVVRGEEISSGSGFGGQIMAMNGGVVRVEGAELTRMGQKNVLRRYPIHFHMLGDAGARSYLKNTSMHDLFNRCVTIHGTNRLTLTGNVCHSTLGHAYFFEDGAEKGNVLDGNLAMDIRRPDEGERLLPSDESPAGFWVTNPNNTLRNNVAAGTEGSGFWYALPEHPTGLSTNAGIWPRRTPLGVFANNRSHSNDRDGLHVDNGPRPDGTTGSAYYDPRQNPADANSPVVVAQFAGFVGYKNRNQGVWLRGENHRLTGAVLADNAIGATFASSESFLQNSLVVGETANKGTPEDWQIDSDWVGVDGRSLPRYWEPEFPIRGFEFYDGRVGTQGTTFANFTPNSQRKASGLGVLLEDAFPLHPRNFVTGARFVASTRVYLPGPVDGKDGDNSAVFVDNDGSVTGAAGRVVTANNRFLSHNGCSINNAWNAYVCPPGTEHVTLISEALVGGPTEIKPLRITRESDGVTQTLMGCCDDSTDAYTNVLPNRRYEVAFNNGTPDEFRFVLNNGDRRWLRLKIPYAKEPKVTLWGCDLADPDPWSWCQGKEGSLAELDSSTTTGYYYDAEADALYLKLYPNGSNYEELKVEPRSNP